MMEGAQSTERAEGFENPTDSDTTSNKPSGASDGPSLRFCVNQVNLDPKDIDENDEDHSPRMNFPDSQSTNRPQSVHDATSTIGYATHDAVPMTVFYRNENSNSNSTKKSRPTLRELRKGFEEDHEQQVWDLFPVCELLIAMYMIYIFFVRIAHAFSFDMNRLSLLSVSRAKRFEVKF